MSPESVLAVLFLFVAILYSSVGLGGGSSYTALMSMFSVDYNLIPTTSLALNLVVTFVGTVNFWRHRHLKFGLVVPFLATSVPMSFIGGALHLPEKGFLWLLLVSLTVVAVRIYLWNDLKLPLRLTGGQRLIFSLVMGALLGFVAGTVGIGGGIYLVPLLILFSLASEKQAAAAGACFIWVNSLAGLISRAQRGTFDAAFVLPLLGVVAVGGFIGSRFGAHRFEPRTIQRILGVVILIAIVYLLWKLIHKGSWA